MSEPWVGPRCAFCGVGLQEGYQYCGPSCYSWDTLGAVPALLELKGPMRDRYRSTDPADEVLKRHHSLTMSRDTPAQIILAFKEKYGHVH